MPLLLNVEVLPGSGLRPVIAEALQLSRRLDIVVRLEFNGIPLDVLPTSDHDKLAEYWEKESRKRAESPTQA